jgi:N-acetylmuramoyl-L-alanine amidase
MHRSWPALLVVLATACSTGDPGTTSTSTSTTIRVPATTTTSTSAVAPIATTPPRFPAAPTTGEVRALVSETGVVVPVFGGRAGAWLVGTPCGRRIRLGLGTPIRGATVLLDPGHGGEEEGAVGANGLTEKDLNLRVARLAAAALEAQGATVVLTRTADYRVTLEARAALAQRLRPPVMVSVHHNGGHDRPSDKPGTETYYQYASPASKRLAGLLYEELLRVFAAHDGVDWHANVDAGAKYRRNDRGGDYYGILRGAGGVTAVLSEALFLSSSLSEAVLLARPDVQAAEAAAITRAVRRFMLGREPGSGFVNPIPRLSPAGSGGGVGGCRDPALGR